MGKLRLANLPRGDTEHPSFSLYGYLALSRKAFLKEHAYNIAGTSLMAPRLRFAQVLNNHALMIVDLLDGVHTLSEIAGKISSELRCSHQDVLVVCDDFLTPLHELGLIRVLPERCYQPVRKIPRHTAYSLEWVDIVLTNRCHMGCIYCSNESKHQEMGDALCDKLIESLIGMGVSRVGITGGEPTLHPRFLEIVQELSKNGAAVSVGTNGSTMTHKEIHRLEDIGLFGVSLSIDSLDATDYPRLNQNAVNPEYLLALIKLLKKTNIHVRTSTVLIPGINATVDKAVRLYDVLDQLKVRTQCFSEALPVGWGINYPLEPAMFDVAAALGSKILGRSSNSRKGMPQSVKRRMGEPDSHLPQIECGIGIYRGAVTAEGHVVPCSKMGDLVAGSLPQGDLAQIWESSKIMAYFRRRKNMESTICRQCRDWQQCRGGCKARAGLYGRSLDFPDLWSCAAFGHVYRAKRRFADNANRWGSFREMVPGELPQ